MPLARYFFFVGGVLLALLSVSDAYLPKLPVVDRASTVLPVIRIHSDRKWPERVVYDTSLPTIISAQIANMEVPATATVANVSAKAQVGQAYAQLQPSDAKQKPELQRKRKIATRRVASPTIMLEERSQFGKSIW